MAVQNSYLETNEPELVPLAQSILSLTQSLSSHLSQLSHPAPTFHSTSAGPPLTLTYESLRYRLNSAALDLLRLVNGPKNTFRTFLFSHYDLAAYQVALEFDFFGAVPLDGKVTVQEIAAKVGIDLDRTSRILRTLATQRVFREVGREGLGSTFEHTALSSMLARDKTLRDAFLMHLDEFFGAASATSMSLHNAPKISDAMHSPFYARHGVPAYEFYDKNPDKAIRFASAMAGVTKLDHQVTKLRDEFNWASLPAGNVVDVGGGSGHVCIQLAREFTHLKFIIQDRLVMLNEGRELWTDGLKDRVEFMEHDLFKPQPIHDASAFFMRHVTHNWTNPDCVRIFRSLVPALEKCAKGTPLLINDHVIPEFGEKTSFAEYEIRQLDMLMCVVLGSKQRSRKEFEALLKEADQRFRLVKANSTETIGFLEVYLDT
ncbi:sterigmatocystin 8-O-methyltransferase precursor [Viridothelium virens]|uniref:Sterigmatocystin 8-O-methyltransferase n=1 Tax=Viridothelium virens TaxID=1048519 RepID=A0A6A6H0I6_VIRVR|nr:sterigmatocystin 8-O-methyltransferase precursor [Viridothelium virens]